MAAGEPYLLGHSETEWSRLEEQHLLWRETLLEPLRQVGLGPGSSVLEVGCGPGVLLRDLVAMVGRDGRAAGLELDARAAEVARRRLGDRVTVDVGSVMDADLHGPWDVIVARWLLCFLPDPGAAVARLASALVPGGHLVVQDYNHDGVRVFPDPGGEVARVIEEMRGLWSERAGDLWIAGRLPGHYAQHGLDTVSVSPSTKAGLSGSEVWRWVERFLHEHLPTLVDAGRLSEGDASSFRDAWSALASSQDATLFSPMQVVVVGRRRLTTGTDPGRRPR